MSAHRWWRDLHLAVGIFLFPVLALYGLSAFQMVHLPLPLPSSQSDTTFVRPAGPVHVDGLVPELRAAGWAGDVTGTASDTAGLVTVTMQRPGMQLRATVDPATGRVTVEKTRAGTVGAFNRLHHAAGITSSEPGTRIWGWLVVLASLGCLVLGASGIVLWLPRGRERKLGTMLLAGSSALGGLLLIVIRLAG